MHTRQTKKKKKKKMLARQHQGMDGAASRQDPETSRRQRRLEKDHQNICAAPTAPQRIRAADVDADAYARLLYVYVFVCVYVRVSMQIRLHAWIYALACMFLCAELCSILTLNTTHA